MRFAAFLLAALAAATGLPARAGQYSDLWWNPRESGWGVSVVQQLETAVVTLFVYGADGKPTWYVATNANVIAYGSTGPLFSGTLYRTRGPFHGGAFDPSKVEVVPVGEVSLEVLAKDRMRVSYVAEGVAVSKEVVRNTWALPLAASHFASNFILRQARPGQAPLGTLMYNSEVLLHVNEENVAFMRVDDEHGRRCEYRGPYVQSGKIGTFSGTYACNGGDSPAGTFEVTDFETSEHGVTGYLRTWSGSLNEYGRFAAVKF